MIRRPYYKTAEPVGQCSCPDCAPPARYNDPGTYVHVREDTPPPRRTTPEDDPWA